MDVMLQDTEKISI